MKNQTENAKPKRCFVMMPFSTPAGYEEGHFGKVYEQIIKPAIIAAGYEPDIVNESLTSTPIVEKIVRGLIECEMAVCDLSSRNPNVLYELGIRQSFNKPVVLIKDEKTERIFDVSGITTMEYSSLRLYENVLRDAENLKKAILENESDTYKLMDLIHVHEATIPQDEKVSEDKIILLELSAIKDELLDMRRQISLSKKVNLKEKIISDNYESEILADYFDFMSKKIKQSSPKELMRIKAELRKELDELEENRGTKFSNREYLLRRQYFGSLYDKVELELQSMRKLSATTE